MTALTEADALTKWCPLAPSAGRPTFGMSQGNTRCIASDCMAWRVLPSLTVDNPTRVTPMQGQSVDTSRGFCGLAGRP